MTDTTQIRKKARLVFRKRLKNETKWNDILLIEEGIYQHSVIIACRDRVKPYFDEVLKTKQVRRVKNIGKDYIYKRYPFREIYRSVLWKTFNALVVHKSKESLWKRVEDGFLHLSDVAKMTHAELDPERDA